jgi:hypothetical protein
MRRRTRSRRSTISSSSSKQRIAKGKTVQPIYFPSPLKDFTRKFAFHVYGRSLIPPLAASHPLVIKAALMKNCSIQQLGTAPTKNLSSDTKRV